MTIESNKIMQKMVALFTAPMMTKSNEIMQKMVALFTAPMMIESNKITQEHEGDNVHQVQDLKEDEGDRIHQVQEIQRIDDEQTVSIKYKRGSGSSGWTITKWVKVRRQDDESGNQAIRTVETGCHMW